MPVGAASAYRYVSILFHHYKELKECMSEVEQMEDKSVNNSGKQRLMKEVKKERIHNTNTIAALTPLDSYLEM
jgi:hypothetical protein